MNKRKFIFVLPVICSPVVLSGCGGMMTATEWFVTGNWVPRITVEEAFGDLKEEPPKNASPQPQKPTQPKNKTVSCKVPSMGQDYTVFWDGSCKNGYAVGLGKITYIHGNDVAERILIANPNPSNGYSDLYFRDYAKKTTLRGKIRNENSDNEKYWAIVEILVDNPLTDEALIHKEFVYQDKNKTVRKSYFPHFDGIITTVEINGLRYFRVEINNPPINAPSLVEGIGKVSDGSLEESLGIGKRNIQRILRLTINGEKYFIRVKNRNKELIHLIGNTFLWTKAETLFETADKNINRLDLGSITSLENLYYKEVYNGKNKRPNGLSKDIYDLNKEYYSQDFFDKVNRTLNNYAQNLHILKQKQNHLELEKARRNSIAAAKAQASTNAILNSILQSNNQALSQSMQNLNRGYSIPAVSPMSPVGPASVDVYNVQRINDNLYGIQKVK